MSQDFSGRRVFLSRTLPGQSNYTGRDIVRGGGTSCAILVALKKDSDQGMPVLARITDSRFKQIVKPGQTVDLHATLDDFTAGFCFFSGKVVCDGKLAVRLKYVSAMLHAES